MKIVWHGDSITLGVRPGVVESQTFAHLISTALGAAYVNTGIAGDTTTGMLARFNSAVVANAPDWVNLMVGENDQGAGISVATFESNLRAMIGLAIQNGIRVALMTPNMSEQAPLQAVVPAYNAVTQKLAAIYNIPFIDVYAWWALWSFNPGGASYAAYFNDAQHPGPAGHQAIASLIGLPQYAYYLWTGLISAPPPPPPPPPPPGGTWLTVAQNTPSRYTLWSDYTLRECVAAPANTGLSEIRVTFQASSPSDLTIGEAFVGYGSSGFNFDVAPTRLTFGGQNSGTAAANTALVSDSVPFTIPAGKRLIVACYLGTSNAYCASAQSASGWSSCFRAGNDTQTLVASGYTASTDGADCVVKIEAE